MSLWLYKFGAWLNALVGLTLIGLFVVLQVAPSLIVNDLLGALNLTDPRIIRVLGVLTFEGRRIWRPILVIVGIVTLFTVGGVVPFLKVNNAITNKKRKVSSLGFFMTAFLSLPFGGGVLMLLSVMFGLRKAVEQERELFYHNQMNSEALDVEDNDYREDLNREETYDYHDETPEYAPAYDRRDVGPKQDNKDQSFSHDSKETKELRDRVANLERRGAYVEDDIYFAQRRNKRRLADLEEDLYSEKRRSRR